MFCLYPPHGKCVCTPSIGCVHLCFEPFDLLSMPRGLGKGLLGQCQDLSMSVTEVVHPGCAIRVVLMCGPVRAVCWLSGRSLSVASGASYLPSLCHEKNSATLRTYKSFPVFGSLNTSSKAQIIMLLWDLFTSKLQKEFYTP